MNKKSLYCLGVFCFVFSMSAIAMAEEYFPDPEVVTPINRNNLEYEFFFTGLVPPSEIYGYEPHGVLELQGGTLFLQHENGYFDLANQSIGIFIDDVYFGSVYTGENPTPLQGVAIDWHQLKSITSNGMATVRVETSPYICQEDHLSLSCPNDGSMEAWLVYDGIVQPVSESVAIDIKPQSCPNPINVTGKGVLPVAILGSNEIDITQIDPATILLNGVAPLRWSMEDVATPYAGNMDSCDTYACNELQSDGFLDLTLKFDKQEVGAALGAVNHGECLLLELTANLKEAFGGTSITGKDVVSILNKGKKNQKLPVSSLLLK